MFAYHFFFKLLQCAHTRVCCFGFNFRFTSTCSYVGVLLFKLDYAWQQGMTTTKPSHPPNPPPNLTYPSLALSSTTFHSRLKTELFKLSYPDSTPAHDTSAATTGYNCSPTLSPRLDLPG